MHKSRLLRSLLRFVPFFLACVPAVAAEAAKRAVLASGGKTDYVIVLRADASEPEKFAVGELARYIRAMSGAEPTLQARAQGGNEIRFADRGNDDLGTEGYALWIAEDGDVVLSAKGGRAKLYAAYDLLERLGCRWLAPQFDFYKGQGEVIPKKPELVLELSGTVIEKPDFAIRKLDVEEGLSHNTENLKRLVEWAPKLRYNTLMVPRDYGGRGRVTWDQWRDALTPECQKRGLIIEVGGHGYENFINADMDGGKLFEKHPEWFGEKDSGTRSKSKRQVFCTSNPEAVNFVTRGVLDYLKSHPEIEVFQLWPPDGADWCTCEPCKALGEPADRQALLVNHVQGVLAKERPNVRLEIIAYSKALLPPTKVKLDPRILVDYCPINQSFEVPINDPSSDRNRDYAAVVTAWRKQFTGDIGLYSYYRKYAWKSLPALIPHYMQADLRFYRTLPLQATMIYGEPGDWGTYELNHVALGRLSWDADANMDAIVRAFCEARYGPEHAEQVQKALVTLGDTVRTVGSLPFTRLKSPEQIDQARQQLEQIAGALPKDGPAFGRLGLMFEYAIRDLKLQHARASKAPEAEVRRQVESIIAFLTEHKDEGVFILTGRNDIDRIMKRYGLQAPTQVVPGE
jgi:hypothetical protein